MLNKKMFVLSILLVSLLAISAVSAATNSTEDIVGIDETTLDVVEETTNESVNIDDNQENVNESDVGTFDDLVNEINSVEDGGILILTKDYNYVNGSVEGITVNKNITISGQGHMLNGNNQSRIINVTSGNHITLENLKLINGNSEVYGGAIYNEGMLTIRNTTLSNNQATGKLDFYSYYDFGTDIAFEFYYYGVGYGGAIYNYGILTITNSTLYNNSASYGGGAIYNKGKLIISNSTLNDNQATGAVTVSEHYGNYEVENYACGGAIYNEHIVTISNSTLNNNQVITEEYNPGPCGCSGGTMGSVIYADGFELNISNCILSNNTANWVTTPVYIMYTNVSIMDCKFTNLSNSEGNFIIASSSNVKINNTLFRGNNGRLIDIGISNLTIINTQCLNNTAKESLIRSSRSNLTIANSIFEDNNVGKSEGIISTYDSYMEVFNTTFIHNSPRSIYYYYSNDGGFVNNSYFIPDVTWNVYGDNLIIIKRNTYITAKNISFEYTNVSNFVISINDESGNFISTSNSLNITIMNDKISKTFIKQIDEGRIYLIDEINKLDVGTWNVTLVFYGNINYNSCNATATISVLPSSSSVTIDEVNTTWDQKTTFTAHVMSENKTINEGTVSFYIDDNFIGNTSVVNGTATLTHDAPGDAGNHIIYAIFNSKNYLSSNNTAKMFVGVGDIEVVDYESIGTFKALQYLIDNSPKGSVLNLTKDYKYVNGSTEGIQINKAITIDGQGHIIDGNQLSRIFYISENGAILKNLTFINGYCKGDGAAINWQGNNGEIDNCNFYNCSCYNLNKEVCNGGAISITGKNMSISNSKFYNNSAKSQNAYGGGIFLTWTENTLIENCIFISNFAEGGGSAIYNTQSKNSTINRCNFTNNFANSSGGAIVISGENNNLTNLYLFNNTAISKNSYGGGICGSFLENSLIVNCTFINNSALGSKGKGGAIYLSSPYKTYMMDCEFYNNSETHSGTIYFENAEYLNISGCNFSNDISGAIVCYFSEHVYINNCNLLENLTANCIIIVYKNSEDCIISNCNFLNHVENPVTNIYIESSSCILDTLFFTKDAKNVVWTLDSNIKFIKRNSNISYNVSSFDYNNPKIFTAYLYNDTNNSLINKTIIFNFVNNTMSKLFSINTNNEGYALLFDDLFNLSVGEWNLTIIFEENDNYYSCNSTTMITVFPSDSSLNIYDINTTLNHEVALVANVNSTLVVNEGVITFFDGETNIGESNVVNGVATLIYTPTSDGEHLITAIFNSDNYLSSNSTAKLLVDSAAVEVLVDNGTVGYNSTFVANIKGLYSTIDEGSVAFYIGDEYLGDVPVVDGSASLVYIPLIAGDYAVKAVFSGSDNFLDDESSTGFTVKSADSEIIINDLNGTVGHELTITVNVVSLNNLTINEGYVIFFDGETNIGENNVVDGVATLTYTPTTAGEHPITAMYYSANYGDPINSALLTVDKVGVDLSIDYISDVYFTNPSNFAININSNYKPVNEGKIKYYVNNELVGTVDVYEGTANFDYVTGTTGLFTLTVAYEETDNYLAMNASTTFTVNMMPTTLSGESVIFDEESYKTFTTELKDNNNNGVGGQPVKIEVIKYSGESATFNGISDSNGITVYDVGRLAGGMWYVTGIYAGNDNYIKSSFADKFLVVRVATTTEIEEIQNPKVNHSYKLKANIHDESGKLVKEGIVQFFLDGVDIGSIDLANNQGHQDSLGNDVLGAANPVFEYVLGADNDVSDLYINYIPTKAGKHTLTAVYEGTTIYKASNSTTTFEVTEENTTDVNETLEPEIDIPSLDNPSDDGNVAVTLPSDATGTVTLSVGGKDYIFDVVNGVASVKLPELGNGNYNYTITYSGDSKYSSFVTNGNMKVNNTRPEDTKPTPEVVIPSLDEPSEDGSVAISLPGDATGIVTLTINGKEYYFAVVKGVANVIIPDLGEGNYPYTITYSGDSKYSSFTNNGTLNKTAPAVDPVITASNVNVVYSAGSYYTIKVYGTDGELADGVKVVITVKGKAFKTLTTANGVAKFKVTNVPGTYKMTITALGKSVTKTLTVKHLVTLKSVTVKKSAKKMVLTATLGKVNKKYLKNKKVTFKFNGKKYTAKTDKKGVAKVTIKSSVLKKLKVGKKVTYQATYSKDTVKKTVKVKK